MKVLDLNTIDLIEQFIKNNKPLLDYPCLSLRDYASTRSEYFNIINNITPVYSLIPFASNAYGFTTYNFYKNSNQDIFIIVIYIDEIQSYYKIDTNNLNWEILISN
jgi:hypothetical protein